MDFRVRARSGMAYRLLRNPEADGCESSEFPISCKSCFGNNPRIRILKAEYEKGCNICTRPFTVFRWNPGHDGKYKENVSCQTCCKLQNLCQVCLLDLEYGLPVQVRGTVMSTNSMLFPREMSTGSILPRSMTAGLELV